MALLPSLPKHWMLWSEWLLLFALLPFGFNWLIKTPAEQLGGISPRALLFGSLWGLTLIILRYYQKQKHQIPWNLSALRSANHWGQLLGVLFFSSIALSLLLYLYEPTKLFQLPKERTDLWLRILIFYPILSVLPQEIIFRLYFFDRYKSIFTNDRWLVVASALSFAHAHLLFGNPIAYILSFIGGLLFAKTYCHSKSLALVIVEHALYGQFIFTIGLGWYFYSGAVTTPAG